MSSSWDEYFYLNEGVIYNKKDRASVKKDTPVSFKKNIDGYFVTNFNYSLIKAHRLIYFLYHKTLPRIVDHIDGDRANNKIENLRAVSNSQNNANSVKKNNGVWFDKRRERWISEMRRGTKRVFMKQFRDKTDAEEFFKMKHLEIYGEYSYYARCA